MNVNSLFTFLNAGRVCLYLFEWMQRFFLKLTAWMTRSLVSFSARYTCSPSNFYEAYWSPFRKILMCFNLYEGRGHLFSVCSPNPTLHISEMPFHPTKVPEKPWKYCAFCTQNIFFCQNQCYLLGAPCCIIHGRTIALLAGSKQYRRPRGQFHKKKMIFGQKAGVS